LNSGFGLRNDPAGSFGLTTIVIAVIEFTVVVAENRCAQGSSDGQAEEFP